jgi:hypothetical protein
MPFKITPCRAETVKMKRGLWSLIATFSFALILLGCSPRPDIRPQETHSKKDGDFFIDVHNHLAGLYGSRLGGRETDFEGAGRVALDTMKKLGIEKMFIMPPPFTPDQPGLYTYEDLIGTVRKNPDRFAFLGGGGTLNVMIQDSVRLNTTSPRLKSQFEKKAMEILSKGAVGFGELTAEHFSLGPDHPYESAPPDHPLFLLLSDIAGRQGIPIDIHMETIPSDMPLPRGRRFESPYNPKMLRANISAFERLLAYNRNTKIIWAHVGWCNTGFRTAALCAELLEKHPNLYMSFKIRPDSMPETRPLTNELRLKDEWLHLIQAYPERFLIGSDHFYMTPRANIQIGPKMGEETKYLLTLLPTELARKVGFENAYRIFKLNH